MAAASSLQKILTAPLVSSSILLSSSFLQVRQEALASWQAPQHDKCIAGSRLYLTACCWLSGPHAVHALARRQGHHQPRSEHNDQHSSNNLLAGYSQNKSHPVLHDTFHQGKHGLAGCPNAKLVPVSAIGEHGSMSSDAHQGHASLATAALLAPPQLADSATLTASCAPDKSAAIWACCQTAPTF